MPRVSVIIPAYNEERGLPKVIEEIPSLVDEIIVVDDGSTDGTYEVARKYDVKLIRHEKNQGKVAAIYTGIKNAAGDVIVLIDADFTYPAGYISAFIKEIEKGSDLVIGSRFLGEVENMSKLNVMGNRILSLVATYLSGSKITDAQSGFRAFKSDFLNAIPISARGLEFETEITVKASKLGYKVVEIPIEYRERIGKSKLNPIRDGYRMFKTLFVVLYNETSVLAKMIILPGILFFVAGLVSGGITLNEYLILGKPQHVYYPILTVLFILMGTQLFSLGIIIDNMTKKIDRVYETLRRR